MESMETYVTVKKSMGTYLTENKSMGIYVATKSDEIGGNCLRESEGIA